MILKISQFAEFELRALFSSHIVEDPIAKVPRRYGCIESNVLQSINKIELGFWLSFSPTGYVSISINLPVQLFKHPLGSFRMRMFDHGLEEALWGPREWWIL
jgi:hypothetical protein